MFYFFVEFFNKSCFYFQIENILFLFLSRINAQLNVLFPVLVLIDRWFLNLITTCTGLYGSTVLQRAEVDHWIWFGLNKFGHGDFNSSLKYCDEVCNIFSYLS